MEANINNTTGAINDVKTLQRLINIFEDLSPESREKMINTISTFFNINRQTSTHHTFANNSSVDTVALTREVDEPVFSQDRTMSPKEFLLEKSPRTDVERVACLAFYLTHYRDFPHFKTIDISKLNTEAAQRKFSNPAKAVDNATRSELLVPSTKGNKQLGAFGEVYVQELPDREAARAAIAKLKPKRKKSARKSTPSTK